MDTTDTQVVSTVVTATDIGDLLMPKLHQKPNHGTAGLDTVVTNHGTAIEDNMDTGTHTDTDIDMDIMDKSLLHFRQEQFFPEFKIFYMSLANHFCNISGKFG